MNEYINYSDNDYLAHYGVPGMKWGVTKKRIQDRVTKNRALTAVSANYAEDKRRAKFHNDKAKQYSNKSERSQKKGNYEKAKEYSRISEEYRKIGENFVNKSKITKQYYDDIKSNTVKAGKDYYVKMQNYFDGFSIRVYGSDNNERYNVEYRSRPMHIGG